MLPARRPCQTEPIASAASSTTGMPCSRPIASSRSIVAQVAVEMHRQDRLGARRDRGLDPVRIEAPAVGQDVDEHRLGAEVHDRRDRGDPVGVGEDDLVARPDAQRGQAHVQRPGAARRGDRVAHAEVVAKARLEAVQVVVAVLAPAVARRVGRVADLELGDRRSRVRNARRCASCDLQPRHRGDEAPAPARARRPAAP